MTKHHIGEQLANSLPLYVKGEPYTIDEIDQHPDRERILRTIQEVAFYLTLDLDSDLMYTQSEADDLCDAAYDRGFSDGLGQVSQRDYDVGYENGFESGNEVGYDKGYKEGFDDGKSIGEYSEGYEKGYVEGFNQALKECGDGTN